MSRESSVLTVCNDHSRASASASATSVAVSGARCVTLADAGHLPQLERPDEFDEVLLEFLRHARAWLH